MKASPFVLQFHFELAHTSPEDKEAGLRLLPPSSLFWPLLLTLLLPGILCFHRCLHTAQPDLES